MARGRARLAWDQTAALVATWSAKGTRLENLNPIRKAEREAKPATTYGNATQALKALAHAMGLEKENRARG